MDNAADFFISIGNGPNEKIIIKLREDIPTKPIEVNIESTGIAQEESVFFDTTHHHETAEKGLSKHKKETQSAISNEPPVITESWFYANDLHKNTKIVNVAQSIKPSRIHIEQDSHPTKLYFMRKLLGLPFGEQVSLKDARYMQHFWNKKRKIIKDDSLCGQN